MTQVARNLNDARDGFLRGVQPLVLPTWSPNLNAFAERFVGSAKSECLELRIVPLGEGHLRAAVRAFVEHYHEERPHQGLGNELIAPKTAAIGTGAVTCRARLGFEQATCARPRDQSCPAGLVLFRPPPGIIGGLLVFG